jgi:hypothetical protein
MGSFSNFWENEILDHVFGTGAYTAPTIYVGLSTADPLDDASGLAEPSGGAYARVAHSAWDVAASGATENTGTVTFPENTASWGTVTHFALFDALSGGNMLAHGSLNASKDLSSTGQTPRFSDGELDITLD